MSRFSLASLASVAFLANACDRSADSSLKEAPDLNNRFSLLGDLGSPDFKMIAANPKVEIPRLPWTDTYWPLTEQGLSARWSKKEANSIGLADFFSSQVSSGASADVDPLLSPADKYDILYRWRHGKAVDTALLDSLAQSWKIAEEGIAASLVLEDKRKLLKDVSTAFASRDNAAFRAQFPLSSVGWEAWLSRTSNTRYQFMEEEDSGENWRWMGSCHGWAPAALMAETPKHAVQVQFGEQKILLTEGDIRGLLTKSWADFSPGASQYFIGRRCNENSGEPEGAIPQGATGRGVYGEIVDTAGGSARAFYAKSEIYAPFARSKDRIYAVSYDESYRLDAYLLETTSGTSKAYALASQLSELEAFISTGESSGISSPSKVSIFGCWDVNPATFHMGLLQKLGKEKIGLVMDRTRTGQVWNQPVFAADFVISDKKSLAEEENPKPHAPGTKFLVEVSATVKWISEPSSPRFVYSPAFDQRHIRSSTYHYVLEFDKKEKLIGGEWGQLSASDAELITPDFIYGFAKDAQPKDNLTKGFDYQGIIAKIHACSLSAATDGSVRINNTDIPFSNCTIEKGP